MKTTARSRVVAALLLGAACLTAPSASARPPRARPAKGKILLVDRARRSFVFKPDEKPPLLLDWTKQTRFVHDSQLTNAIALKAGLSGTVYYRSPLFGNAYATKIVWTNGGQ